MPKKRFSDSEESQASLTWVYKPEAKPKSPHVTGYDFRGLPVFNGWSKKTRDATKEACKHRDEWGYMESAQNDVPPCILYAARVKREGCPSRDEMACFFRSVRAMTGKPAETVQEAVRNAPQASQEAPESTISPPGQSSPRSSLFEF